MEERFCPRTWIDIDLDALIANYQTAKGMTQALVTCVVKSNAYGHGAVRVAQALQEAGCESFAVSCAREGIELRRAGIRGEILVMGLTEQGMFSHLGLITAQRDQAQYDALMRMQSMLEQRGLQLKDIHLCDSIGLVRYPAWHMSRVRVGALLYGVRPFHTEHMPFEDRESLAFRTTVSQVRDVAAGEVVGYSDDQVLEHPARIATLCAGYGDGYPRCLSNGKGKVLIRGKLAPVVGLICMDQMMVDVSGIPEAAPGDVATLLGDGISYATYADWCNTNRNECISILSRRPVRVYRQGGKIVTVLDSLLEERSDFA